MRPKRQGYDWHHRRPSSKGGDTSDKNMSHVPTVKHQAWHLLFTNLNPQEIADIINEVWLDNDWKFILERKQSHDE